MFKSRIPEDICDTHDGTFNTGKKTNEEKPQNEED